MLNSEYISAELLLLVPLLVVLEHGLNECTDLCEKQIMAVVFLAGIVLAVLYTFCTHDVSNACSCEALLVAVTEGLIVAALAYFVIAYWCPALL